MPVAPAFAYCDVNHVLSTGQSLAVGAVGSPSLSKSQPYKNVMFNTGVLAGGDNLQAFVPLVEHTVETMSSALANDVAKWARELIFKEIAVPKNDHVMLVSNHGRGGVGYSGLKRGSAQYEDGLEQVRAAKAIAGARQLSYVVRAVTNVHGEADHALANMNYGKNLLQWQNDYEKDVQKITGQTAPVPMLHSQFSSWTRVGNDAATSKVAMLQLEASRTARDKVVMVMAKYHLPYARDGIHLNNLGYRLMGEYYAKAYRRLILEGRPWTPLWPSKVSRAGAAITIAFDVPVPPLALDTTLVSNPGQFGFEFADDSASAPIVTGVKLAGPTTVEVTLSSIPVGANKRLRYAYTGIRGSLAGPQSGPRGNLRDSDTIPSAFGAGPLYNWSVHFDEPCP